MGSAVGRLSGKVAIITGASTGTGPVMAKLFVQEGARVLLAARREELVLQAARDAGEGAVAMRADHPGEYFTNEWTRAAMLSKQAPKKRDSDEHAEADRGLRPWFCS